MQGPGRGCRGEGECATHSVAPRDERARPPAMARFDPRRGRGLGAHLDGGVGDDDHRVGRRCEALDERRIAHVAHLRRRGDARAGGSKQAVRVSFARRVGGHNDARRANTARPRDADWGGGVPRGDIGARNGRARRHASKQRAPSRRTCMVENWACVLEQESLNCLMMLETFSKR